MLTLLYESIPALDPRTRLTDTGNQLDPLYTSRRNTTGTSQPTSLNDSLNPTPHNLLTHSVPRPIPATTTASSIRTRI
jgi:hypothetical protein